VSQFHPPPTFAMYLPRTQLNIITQSAQYFGIISCQIVRSESHRRSSWNSRSMWKLKHWRISQHPTFWFLGTSMERLTTNMTEAQSCGAGEVVTHLRLW